MRDFFAALNDGMVAHRGRAWFYSLTVALVVGLALCTALGLIPLHVWGDVLTMPLAWLVAGGFWLSMVKLWGLAFLLMAVYVAVEGWWPK